VRGEFVPESNAVVNVKDLAVVRGYGTFDYFHTYNGKPVTISQNVKRLRRSCEQIELEYPWTDEQIEDIVLQTLEKNKGRSKEFDIRIILTGGISSTNMFPDGEPTLIVMVRPLLPTPSEFYTDGVKVISYEGERLLPDAKSINYITAVIAQKRARKAKAIEAIYHKNGVVTEGTTVNIFAFYGNKLVTPEQSILKGITRSIVLEVCQSHFEISVRTVTLEELYKADEVFITSASKHALPVIQIDDVKIGNGKVGENTKKVLQFFNERIAKDSGADM